MVQAIMRKNQRLIWTVIAVVVVITFVFWGSMTGPGMRSTGSPGTLYGKSITMQEYRDAQLAVHTYFLFAGQDLTRSEQGRQMLDQQTWLRLIERRKLEQWNITVTDDELLNFIQTLFQTDGRFDPNKYRDFVDRRLPAMGIRPADFEKMMREQLCLQELQRIIGSTAKAVPTEARSYYSIIHEKLDVSLVMFDGATFTNEVKLTDAEIKDYFEKNTESFRIPERRRVRYVRFSTEAHTNEVKITDAEVREVYDKNKAMFEEEKGKPKPFESVRDEIRQQLIEEKAFQRASERATEMALEIVKPQEGQQKEADLTKIDFAVLARKFGAAVQETDYFTLGSPVPGIDPRSDFSKAAFALTPKEPFSDAVGGPDGAYVLQYLDQKDSELPTLDAVKEKVRLRLLQERATDLARTRGHEADRLIKNAVLAAEATAATNKIDAAKLFAVEAQKLNLKVLNPPPFSQQELVSQVPNGDVILNVAFGMREGEVSDFVDTGRGGLFLLLKKRITPTDAEYAKDAKQFDAQVLAHKREGTYNDWVNMQIRIANPPFLTRPQRPPQSPEGQPAAPQQTPPS